MTLTHRGNQNNQVAVRDEGVYSPVEGAVLHEHDQRPPVLKLVQSTSGEGTPGTFRRLDTEEEFDSIEVVPLLVQATRTYWGPGGFERDSKPLCYSVNGVSAAVTTVDGTPTKYSGQRCVGCPKYTARPWEQRAEDDYCSPGYFTLLMDINSFEVYVLRLNGTMSKFGRVFAARGVLQTAVLALTAEKVTNKTGSWYMLKARTARKLDEAEIDVVKAQYENFGNVGASVVDEQSETAPEPTSEPRQEPIQAEKLERVQGVITQEPSMVYAKDGTPVTRVLVKGSEGAIRDCRGRGDLAQIMNESLGPGQAAAFEGVWKGDAPKQYLSCVRFQKIGAESKIEPKAEDAPLPVEEEHEFPW